jgi:hypothetical protein
MKSKYKKEAKIINALFERKMILIEDCGAIATVKSI